MLIGYYNIDGEEKSEPESYHFDKSVFKKKAQVTKWLKDHDLKTSELVMAKKESDDVKENKSSWDGATAKQSLFDYATDKDGNIEKGKIEKFFLEVSNEGKVQSDYKYPVGKIVEGEPLYDFEGLKAAFSAAMGSHTGTSHPKLAKMAAKIAKQEFKEDLTSGMKEELNMKENAIISKKGEVYEETIPIDRVPDKVFGNVRQGDIPELLDRSEEVDPESIEVLEGPEDDESEGTSEEDDSEEMPESSSEGEGWQPEKSKQDFMDWAKDDEGKISKKDLMKWYLDIDGGDGQDPTGYRYPVGAIIEGEPHHCPQALDHSWQLASGNETGIANRNIQKKIVFLKNRYNFPLTEEQMDFTERHMSADKVSYHEIEDDNSPGGIEFVPETELKMNSSPAGSNIIYEDDNVIDVPVVPMREGVFTGTDGIPTLKKFEYFGKDAHWLEGQPILKGHTRPTEFVTYKHNRIGKLINVTARPDKKDVVAVARYYKEKLSPEDLTRIRSNVPYDGSIAYTTHTSFQDGDYEGHKYNAVEDGGYHFYHFAELANGTGACSTKDGCGFNLNEAMQEVPEIHHNENFWSAPVRSHITVLNQQLKDLEKQYKSSNDPSLEVDIKKLKDDVAKWQKQLTKLNPQSQNSGVNTLKTYYNNMRRADIEFNGSGYSIKLNSTHGNGVLETSDNEQANNWAQVYVRSGKVPVSMKLNYCGKKEEQNTERSQQNSQFSNISGNNMTEEEFIQADDETVIDVQKMNETFEAKLNERDSKISELETQLSELVQKQNAVDEAIVAEKAKADFEAFSQKLNAASQKDAEAHYKGFMEKGWSYFDEHPVFKAEVPKMNARGVSAGEGDNGSGLKEAREMFKKAQKDRYTKRPA